MATPDFIEVDPAVLPEIESRLGDRHAGVLRELESLGKPPDGRKAVTAYCRNFGKAFKTAVDSVEIASQIRRTFNSNDGLSGAVKKLPVEKKFVLANVKQVCREADGFQAHLVSPEAGLRRLIQESMKLIDEPCTTAVRQIHLLLVEASRQASRNASKYTETGLFDPQRGSSFPILEQAISTEASRILEVWREDALAMVRQLVQMEEDYVTAAFFRHAVSQRLHALQQQQEAMQQLAQGTGNQVGEDDDDSENEDDDDSTLDGSEAPTPMSRSTLGALGSSRPAGAAIGGPAEDEFKMGYLQKRIGEHSGRQNLPEGWKWQKRWFVFTDSKAQLYYFKTADDPPNYRGVVNIRDCTIEDLDAQGRPVKQSQYDLGGGNVSTIFRISHKDPSKPVIKKHDNITLKAENPAEKFSWMMRLRAAADGPNAYSTPVRAGPPTLGSAPTMGGSKRSPPGGAGGRGPPQQTVIQHQQPAPLPPGEGVSYSGGIGRAVPFGETAKLANFTNLFAGLGRSSAPPQGFGQRDEASYEQFLETLAIDTKQYVKEIYYTLTHTVPKAIVHTQVKRAEMDLLDVLQNYAFGLKDSDVKMMTQEDAAPMQKRAAAQNSLEDIKAARAQAKLLLQEMDHKAEADRPPKIEVPYRMVELSGLYELLPEGAGHSSPYGDYTPRALQGKSPFTENGNSTPAAANPSPKPRRRPPPAPPANTAF